MANYFKRTQQDLFEEIKRIAADKAPDKNWNGLSYGSLSYVLGQTTAEIAQLILYNLDLRASESYVERAQLRQSLRLLAELMGHTVNERTGATTTLSITASDDTLVPRGTKISSSGGIIFTTLADLALTTAGSLTGTVLAVHADYAEIVRSATGIEAESISIPYNNLLLDHLTVTVDSTEYTRVSNFSASGSTSTHFVVKFNDNETAQVIFGDGVYGARLAADSTITLDIHYGGGYIGNGVAAADLTNLRSVFTGSNYITAITNSTVSSGGGVGDSLDTIRRQIQARNLYRAGVISRDSAADIVTGQFGWLHDAIIDSKFVASGGLTIPTAVVYAYPESSTVEALSGAQDTELTSFLATRGEIGVDWQVESGINAPLEIEIDVAVNNDSLRNQTQTAIENALNTDDDAPFAFANTKFDSDNNLVDLTQTINDVSNVRYAKITRLHRTPQTIIQQGVSTDDDWLSDIELGENAEDGYIAVSATSTTAFNTDFFLPVEITGIGSASIVSNSSNWIKQAHEWDTGAELNDSNGPYIKDGGKLLFRQSTRVWKTNEWTGTYWNSKCLLYLVWADDDGETQQAWYTIASNTYNIITTTEDAASPISGTAIVSLANAAYSNIRAYIVRDLSEGVLVGTNGNSYVISHNTGNTIYTSESTVTLPMQTYAHVRFSEATGSAAGTSYQANSDVVRFRITAGTMTQGTLLHIYTTPLLAQRLKYKNNREVYTLPTANITINWI